MAKRFTIEAVFKMIDGVTAPITRIQNRIQKFTRSTFRNMTRLNRSVDKFSSSLKRMGAVGGVAVAAAGVVVSNLVTTVADFGRAIGIAAANFPEGIKRGTKEFRELEEVARNVGATTEFTAIQAANGLVFLAKAGITAKDSMKSLPSIVDFATASQVDLASAADMALDTLNAFGLNRGTSEERLISLNRVMDVMAKSAKSANVTVLELFESMKKGGSISEVAGLDIETFMATMAFLGGNAIKGGTGGIAAKNIALALAGVGNQAAKTFQRLEIPLVDKATGDLRSQLDVLDDLREKLKEFGTGEQVAIINAIFGKIPIAAAAKLVGRDGEKVRVLLDKIRDSLGFTKKVAGFIRGDLRGSLDALFSAIENVKIGVFESNGALKNMIDTWVIWIRVNEKLISSNIREFFLMLINNFDTIVTWIKNIAIGLAVFFAFTTVLKTLILVMTAFNLIVAINPLVLMGIAIAAIVVGFIALVTWVDEVADSFEDLPIAIRLALLPLELFVNALKLAKKLSKFGFNVVTDTSEKTAELIAPATDAVFAANDKAVSFLDSLFQVLKKPISSLDSLFQEAKKPVSQVVNTQARVERSITERNNTTSSEIVIRTDTANAEIVKNGLGSNLKLEQSGGI